MGLDRGMGNDLSARQDEKSSVSPCPVEAIRNWQGLKESQEQADIRFVDGLCHTQEEIAERENVTKETVSEVCQKMAALPKSDKSLADHAIDFDPPPLPFAREDTSHASHYGMLSV